MRNLRVAHFFIYTKLAIKELLMSNPIPNSITKHIVLRAPLERVWRALSDADEYGQWFGVRFDGPFVAHTPVTGKIVPTVVDPEVAKLQEPHAGTPYAWDVGDIEPMHRISFHWHPFAIEKGRDYSAEPKTTIVFTLEEVAEGVRLTVTESGFDAIPLERRADAFRANDGGWAHQMKLIEGWIAR